MPPQPQPRYAPDPQPVPPLSPMPTGGTLFCLCRECFQEAIWNGEEYEALCARCEAFACTNWLPLCR